MKTKKFVRQLLQLSTDAVHPHRPLASRSAVIVAADLSNEKDPKTAAAYPSTGHTRHTTRSSSSRPHSGCNFRRADFRSPSPSSPTRLVAVSVRDT